MSKTLKVFPVGNALVTDFEALEAGFKRFIGRKFDATVGDSGGFVPVKGSVEIPNNGEYIHALRAGDLEPADEYTAKLCGKPFAKPKADKGAE